MPREYRDLAFGTEYYVLATGARAERDGWAHDLFS
jgi:hypothetical protein